MQEKVVSSSIYGFTTIFLFFLLLFLVKLLDWGEEGNRSESEVAALRAAFCQEVSVWHKLDHPNVTKVFFFSSLFLYNGFLYFNIIYVIREAFGIFFRNNFLHVSHRNVT